MSNNVGNRDKGELSCHWAGILPFEKSLFLQKELKKSAKKSKFCFFGFESSKAVVSLGLKSGAEHILWPKSRLKEKGLSCCEVKRGGGATLHSPGQLVIYPVIHLPFFGLRVKDFISSLEEISIDFFKSLNVQVVKQGDRAGLWTARGKICFFGIHISEGLSQQGLSINVENDLSLFSAIKSCGEAGRKHDKLSFYPGIKLCRKELFLKWCDKAFAFFNKLRSLPHPNIIS